MSSLAKVASTGSAVLNEQSSEADGLTPLGRGAQNHALLKVAEKPRKLGASEFEDIVSSSWGANEHRNLRSQRLAGKRDLRGDLARAKPNPGVEHRSEFGFARSRREIKTTKQSPQGRSRSSHCRHQRLRQCHPVVESRLGRTDFGVASRHDKGPRLSEARLDRGPADSARRARCRCSIEK